MDKQIVLIVIIIIILIFFSNQIGKITTDISYMCGFFESNAEFNDEAGIKTFIIYIGKKYNINKYPVYILMISNEDDKILINSPSIMTILLPFNFNRKCYTFNICFSDLNSDFMPNNLAMKFYPKSSKIILSKCDIIYGCMFKNPVLTELDLIKNNQ